MVAASLKKKNLKIEAEKGFRRTLFEPELVDPNMEINFVKDSEASFLRLGGSPRVIVHRKGNILNDNIHVDKESAATHDADLTMFSNNWRVVCSPLMVVLKIGALNQLV